MAETAISLPFAIDANGKVAITVTQEKIWADRVRGVIGTTFRERVMRPNFGSAVVETLFEQADESIVDITQQVEEAFDEFLPTLTLTDVVIDEDIENGTMNIDITYSLPNEKEVRTNIGVIDITRSQPPVEELSLYREPTYE